MRIGSERVPSPFSASERDWLRQELGLFFSTYPRLADGFLLRAWKSGPHKHGPKIPPAVQTMLDRGLVEIRAVQPGFRAFLTEQGMEALRLLVLDHRAMNPVRFGHVHAELGLNRPDSAPEMR